MLDGAPDAVKVACPVLAGGKAGDNIKGLPIGTVSLYPERKRYPETGEYDHCKYKRGRRKSNRRFLGQCDLFVGGKKPAHRFDLI